MQVPIYQALFINTEFILQDFAQNWQLRHFWGHKRITKLIQFIFPMKSI